VCRNKLAEQGDALEIDWVTPERRYAEKLATPDVTIADLIGEVDPIKVAEGKYLSDEEVIHFGLIPRVNRGIFSINELPDLAEKVQVGLFNIMQERDVQIKGFSVRLELDVLIVASANPEDYTNRGRIITPLKDRYSSQIRTHYPVSQAVEASIVEQERRRFDQNGYAVILPEFMQEILTQVTFLARQNPDVNQHSGVSVRMSISNTECLLSNAEKRAIRLGEKEAIPRISDLPSIVSSTSGKLEMESFSLDGKEDKLVSHLISAAVKQIFDKHFEVASLAGVVKAFQDGATALVSDSLPSEEYARQFSDIEAIRSAVETLTDIRTPAMYASVAEFILEGLYLHHQIHKESLGGKVRYKG
jgi:magnesium chelatase subunit I